MGRHHARLLQSTPRIAFAGAVDPGGDRYGAVHDPASVYGSIHELLEHGKPDFAVVAVPTDEHLAVARTLAAAGVHMLIEKPLAGTVAEAQRDHRRVRAGRRSAPRSGTSSASTRRSSSCAGARRRARSATSSSSAPSAAGRSPTA